MCFYVMRTKKRALEMKGKRAQDNALKFISQTPSSVDKLLTNCFCPRYNYYVMWYGNVHVIAADELKKVSSVPSAL